MNNLITISMLVLAALWLNGCGTEQVDEGYRGIKLKWGRVEGEPLNPGLYFYNPVSSSIFEMDVREHKVEGDTQAFTKDTQSVKISYALTIYPKPEKIGHLYSQFGKDWTDKIVNQAVLGSMKDAIGKYIADELVQKREEAKKSAEAEVKQALAERGIIATRLDFTNLDFDDNYEKAVEAKVVAIQRSAEAKNKTIQIEEEAKQKVKSAEADATAMRIKTSALSQSKGLVEYEAVQRWDGKLPEIMMGNSVPIINLEALKKH